MLGTIINTVAIVMGSLVGLFIKGGISEKISDTIMKGLALCVIYIGISGSLQGENTMITIICIALGALVGEIIDIDEKLEKLGSFIENKVNRKNNNKEIEATNTVGEEAICAESDTKVSISQGFVYASLIFCVGAMAIVGSLESGLNGNHSTLIAKSILDGISSIIFTASLGIGVMFSAGAVFVYQGLITLGSGLLAGVLSTSVITAMTAIGSLLIFGLGLNMLGVTKIKVANLLPAVFIPI
ncbi:MAG: DUF554 domain-containing protein, partial [Peptostreptococcaceae bacterium]